MDAHLVTNVLVSKAFIDLLKAIFSGIVLWLLISSIKDYFSSLIVKNRIKNDDIISIDSYIEINGTNGIVKEITRQYVKLEERIDNKLIIYYIPITVVVNSVIKKILYTKETGRGK